MLGYQLELNQTRITEHLNKAQNARNASRAQAERRVSLRYQLGLKLVRWGFALAGYKLDQKKAWQ